MRSLWDDMLTGIAMGLVVPGLILNFAAAMLLDGEESVASAAVSTPTEITLVQTEPPDEFTMTMLLNTGEGMTESKQMDDYLVNVLLAEMPAYFESEALKAQAVVARTYTVRAELTGGKHGDGSVCMRSECCQAYISEEKYLETGGTEESVQKIRSAVEETSGMVLYYDGQPIEATYFSCSGGKTEDAAAVWGTDYPYLRSVTSPGEEGAAHYRDTKVFTKEAFAEALDISVDGAIENWIGVATYTGGNGIAQMTIGGKNFTGTQLRQLLNLRSTAITMEVIGDDVHITTMGYGHRVGMSQYGADAMAAAGSSYQDILAHYYSGAQLVRYRPEEDIIK